MIIRLLFKIRKGYKMTFIEKTKKDFKKNKYNYLIILPVLIYLILFSYKPMYGVVIAFQRYQPTLGIAKSKWVGFENFIRFFNDMYFTRVVGNTLKINLLSILFSFPAPIILALVLNEVKVSWFKRTVQTITYLPYFIATMVMCNLIIQFCRLDGVASQLVQFFGGKPQNLLMQSEWFYPIYIISDIWQQVGWGSILYLAALSGIDQEQYEAAKIDGAGRLQQIRFITLPGIITVVTIQLILRIGSILKVGYEKILLLYNELTYDVADVISTYVYRKGLVGGEYSYSTAVDLFNSVVGIIFLLAANKICKKLGQSGLF